MLGNAGFDIQTHLFGDKYFLFFSLKGNEIVVLLIVWIELFQFSETDLGETTLHEYKSLLKIKAGRFRPYRHCSFYLDVNISKLFGLSVTLSFRSRTENFELKFGYNAVSLI